MKLFIRNILFIIILFVTPLIAAASNEPTVLLVNLKGGEIHRFTLSEKPVITFDSEHVFINSSAFSTVYENVEKIYFQDNTTTSVKNIDEQVHPRFSFKFTDGHTITVIGCTKTDRLAVYSINGAKVSADVERTAESIVVDLTSVPSGIYIIRVNTQSFKIQKR